MSGIGAALGVASIAGSAIAGSMESSAVTGAANTAANEQMWALQQQQQMEAPYMSLGTDAMGQLRSLLGLPAAGAAPGATAGTGGNAPTASTLAALEATPGYQFTKTQGLQATQNAAASSGMLLSGNTLKGLTDYASGLADTTYEQAVQNAQNSVGIGQAAASGQAANVGQAATNMGQIAIGAGQSQANIDANTLAGIERGIGNLGTTAKLNLSQPSSLSGNANSYANEIGALSPSDMAAYGAMFGGGESPALGST